MKNNLPLLFVLVLAFFSAAVSLNFPASAVKNYQIDNVYAVSSVSGSNEYSLVPVDRNQVTALLSSTKSGVVALNPSTGSLYGVVVRATQEGATSSWLMRTKSRGKSGLVFPGDFEQTQPFTTVTSASTLKKIVSNQFFPVFSFPAKSFKVGDFASEPKLGWASGLADTPRIAGISVRVQYPHAKPAPAPTDIKTPYFLRSKSPAELADPASHWPVSWNGNLDKDVQTQAPLPAPAGDYFVGVDVFAARAPKSSESTQNLYNVGKRMVRGPVHLVREQDGKAAQYLLKSGESIDYNGFTVKVDASSEKAGVSVTLTGEPQAGPLVFSNLLGDSNQRFFQFGSTYTTTVKVPGKPDVKLSFEASKPNLDASFLAKYSFDENALPVKLDAINKEYLVVTLQQYGKLKESLSRPTPSPTVPVRQPSKDELKSYGLCNAYVQDLDLKLNGETVGFRLDTVSGTCRQACGQGQSWLSWDAKKNDILSRMQDNGYEVTQNGAPFDYASAGTKKDNLGRPYVKVIQECPDKPAGLQCCTSGPTSFYQVLYPKTQDLRESPTSAIFKVPEFKRCNAFKDVTACQNGGCAWNELLTKDPTTGESIFGGCRPNVAAAGRG